MFASDALHVPELQTQETQEGVAPEPPNPAAQRLEDIQAQCSILISELDTDQNPEAVVKKHIAQLEKYTDLQDIALGLVTMIADQRKLCISNILDEMRRK
ncbi:pachytene arrest protein Sae3p [[Candida] anglica]|uniref:Pachytene arrest protein Sae3p n=1 Tax=[Candida] anglica TaxID=148631 RepID=A0ABP0EBQ1_9ASCO